MSAGKPMSDAEMADAAMGKSKPRLLLDAAEPAATAARIGHVLASTGLIYDRGTPVKVVRDKQTERLVLHRLSAPNVTLEVDRVARPFIVRRGGNGPFEQDTAVSKEGAAIYLADRGGWGLLPIDGIAAAPLLQADGAIRSVEGYDPVTRMYCDTIPDVSALIPERPSRADAERALAVLRERFCTFAFADAPKAVGGDGVTRVCQDCPPGADESAFLMAMTMNFGPPLLMDSGPPSGRVIIWGGPWARARC